MSFRRARPDGGIRADKTIEVQRRAVASNLFPLWEYERQTGKLRFTHPVDNPQSMETYISMVGKFRHLNKDEIAHLQKTAEERVRILKAIEASGAELLKAV